MWCLCLKFGILRGRVSRLSLGRGRETEVRPLRMSTDCHPRAAAVLEAIVCDDGAAVPTHIATALAEALGNLSDPVPSARKADVDRVTVWLERNPWELRKCRSLQAALRTIGGLIGETPITEPPLVSESRSVPIPGIRRSLLLQSEAAGLPHVRYAALADHIHAG